MQILLGYGILGTGGGEAVVAATFDSLLWSFDSTFITFDWSA